MKSNGYTLESNARLCGEAFKDVPVSVDPYLQNEAFIAFINGQTDPHKVRDLAAAIHENLTRLSNNELSGLNEFLYSHNDRVSAITARLQSEIAKLTTEKTDSDEAICENGNGSGKSERLTPG